MQSGLPCTTSEGSRANTKRKIKFLLLSDPFHCPSNDQITFVIWGRNQYTCGLSTQKLLHPVYTIQQGTQICVNTCPPSSTRISTGVWLSLTSYGSIMRIFNIVLIPRYLNALFQAMCSYNIIMHHKVIEGPPRLNAKTLYIIIFSARWKALVSDYT